MFIGDLAILSTKETPAVIDVTKNASFYLVSERYGGLTSSPGDRCTLNYVPEDGGSNEGFSYQIKVMTMI